MDSDDRPDVDANPAQGPQPPSSRGALDRARIIAAAIAYVDESNVARLTMRRLGAELGVEAMSLYRYVSGKEDLLDGIAEALVGDMTLDGTVALAPTDGWRDFVRRLAHGVRRVALAHPKSFPLVVSRPAEAPWLVPPLRSLQWVELFLAALTTEGFAPESSAAAYRAFNTFLLGHLLLELSTHGADGGPVDGTGEGIGSGEDLDGFPHVRNLRGYLSQDHARAEFEESLALLLERLSLIRVPR